MTRSPGGYAAVFLALLLCLPGLVGCVAPGKSTGTGKWGGQAHLPSLRELGSAARVAAVDSGTWLPFAGGAVLLASGQDDELAESIARRHSVFGDDAAGMSDDLRDWSGVAYGITALLVPSDTWQDKAKGISVGLGTAFLEASLTKGLKTLAGRERPNGANDHSMPSGHAAQASSRTSLARYNVARMDIPAWSKHAANASLYTLAIGTGWARVEAQKHHPADVLVGYALGNFLAVFMTEAFMDGAVPGQSFGFSPMPGGGMLTLTVPLR